MQLWKRPAILVLAVAALTAASNLQAQNTKITITTPVEQGKVQAEFKETRKKEYLKHLAEREKYYTAMAAEMRALSKACAGEDKEACKKAKEHAKTTREKLQETRKTNSDQFKSKMQEYRTKLGKDAPNAAEKDSKALKANPAPAVAPKQ